MTINANGEPRLIEGLLDFKMRKFISRKVGGWAYGVLAVLVVIGTPIGAVAAFLGLRDCRAGAGASDCVQRGSSFICEAPLDCSATATSYFGGVAAAIAGVMVLLMVRLAMETQVALVAIAQNTEPHA